MIRLNLEKNQLKIGIVFSYIVLLLGFVIYFFITPIILKNIGKTDYGLYSLVLSIINYLNLLEFGLNSAYIRYYLKFKSENKEVLIGKLNSTFFIIFLVIGIISMVSCLTLSVNPKLILENNISLEYIHIVGKMLKIVSITVLFSFVNILFNCYLISNEKFLFQRGLNIIKLLSESLIILSIVLFGRGIIGIIYTKMSIVIFITIVNILYCIKFEKMKFCKSFLAFKDIKKMFSFSSFIFFQMMMDQILWNIDKLILSKVSGANEVAIYSLGAEINSHYILIATTISGVFIPRVNQIEFSLNKTQNEKNNSLTDIMITVARLQFLTICPIFMSFIFFGKKFILFWVGENYIKSYYIILLLILPVTFPLIQSIGIAIERAKNKQKFMCIVGFVLAIFNLIISIPLAKLYGGIGSAIGTALTLVIGFIFIRNWFYNKKLYLDIKKYLFSVLKLFPLIVAMVLIGIIMIKLLNVNSFIELLLNLFIYNTFYLVMLWILVLNREEKIRIKKIFMRC